MRQRIQTCVSLLLPSKQECGRDMGERDSKTKGHPALRFVTLPQSFARKAAPLAVLSFLLMWFTFAKSSPCLTAWFPWVTRAISSLEAVVERMSTQLHTGTPQRASTKSCKSEGLLRLMLLCSKVTVGGTQIHKSLWKKTGFGYLLQAKTFLVDLSEGKKGKNNKFYTCLWVTFVSRKTPSPEPPAADCSHSPSAHDFGEARKKWVRSWRNFSG